MDAELFGCMLLRHESRSALNAVKNLVDFLTQWVNGLPLVDTRQILQWRVKQRGGIRRCRLPACEMQTPMRPILQRLKKSG